MEKNNLELDKSSIIELSDFEASQIKGGSIIWRVIWYILQPLPAGYGSDNVPKPAGYYGTVDIDSWGITPPGINTCVSDNA